MRPELDPSPFFVLRARPAMRARRARIAACEPHIRVTRDAVAPAKDDA